MYPPGAAFLSASPAVARSSNGTEAECVAEKVQLILDSVTRVQETGVVEVVVATDDDKEKVSADRPCGKVTERTEPAEMLEGGVRKREKDVGV